MWLGISQSIERMNKTKGRRRSRFASLPELTPSFSSDMGHPGSPSFRLKSRLTKLVPDHGTSVSRIIYIYVKFGKDGRKVGGRRREEEEKKGGKGD